jgi:hypothetical protein
LCAQILRRLRLSLGCREDLDMPYTLRGRIEINRHCSFPCEEIEGLVHRVVHVDAEQCSRCVAELLRLAPRCAFRLIDDRQAMAKAGGR